MNDSPKKGASLALLAVIAVAVTGYFVGLHQTRSTSNAPIPDRWRTTPHRPETSEVPEVVDYSKLPLEGARWASSLASLPHAKGEVPTTPASTKRIFEAIRARTRNRAFAGAPPSIPHPIATLGEQVCLACHQQPLQIGDRVTPMMSHPLYVNCTQCHVEDISPSLSQSEFASLFGGLSETRGDRAFRGAPPTIPHTLWMRQSCASCHGPTGPEPLRTTHPERHNCTQCHVAPGRQEVLRP